MKPGSDVCRAGLLTQRRAASGVGDIPAFQKRWFLTDSRFGALRRGATRCCMMATALGVVVVGAASAQTMSAQPGTPDRTLPIIRVSPENVRMNNYLHDLASPAAVVGVISGGVIAHLRDQPAAWDNDVGGLASRIASRAGQAAVQVSVRHGLAALMHRSTGYQPCDCHGFGPRVEHALLESFTDHRADGSRALAIPRFAGAYAGSFARLSWEHDKSVGATALGTTTSLGFSALVNVVRELSGIGR